MIETDNDYFVFGLDGLFYIVSYDYTFGWFVSEVSLQFVQTVYSNFG